MNDRIHELAKECYVNTGSVHTDHFAYWKFAELIVRECIKQGDTLAKHYIDTYPEQEQVMLLASIADYSKEIKKHFGVEE